MAPLLQAECVVDCKDLLGEGPLWCTRGRVLYWVDCARKLIHAYVPSSHKLSQWQMSAYVGSLAVREHGGLLVALRTGLLFYDPKSGIEMALPSGSIDFERERLNDGKVDRAGRFWVGTADRHFRDPEGSLYVILPDLSIARKANQFTVGNGIAWSPESKTMYFCDSLPGAVYAYEYDLVRGVVENRRVFLDLSTDPYRPDGCTVDSQGFLWVAQPHAHRVARYDPAGKLSTIVLTPGARASSAMFGGDDLGTLFITTMRLGATPDELANNPTSGGLFAVRPGVAGLPEPRFSG